MTVEPVTPTELESHRPLRADARRNRERILKAARAVFGEAGVDAQIDDVAHRAGLGVGTVYRHFPTKEALMVELVRQKVRVWVDNARAALADGSDPFAALAGLLRLNAEQCAADAIMQQAVTAMGINVDRDAAAEIGELRALSAELVERAHRAGSMRADVTADDLPMLMCGVASTMAHDVPGFDWRRHLELVIAMLGYGCNTGGEVAP